MIKLSDYVYNFLAKQQVGHVFVLPGGGCMHLVDSLGRNPDLAYVSSLHEQGAAIAAVAYAQYTNNLGVALVTTGPGGTNAITGVAGAWTESVPLLILSGQVKRADITGRDGPRTLGFQEIDITGIVDVITKYAVTVLDPARIRFHLEKAVYLARSGRPGPVWLDIPLDVQAARIDETALVGFEPEASDEGAGVDLSEILPEVVRLVERAERPLILAGYGIKLSGAQKSFLNLVERLQIPVLTTWKAIDLIGESHPLFCGRPGAVGQRGANFVQQNCDLLLSIGARLDLGQIAYSYGNFARAAKKIVVDVDARELNKLKFDDQLHIRANAGAFIDALAANPPCRATASRAGWLGRSKDWAKRYPVVQPDYFQQQNSVSTYALVDLLSDELSSDDLIVPGSSGGCSDVFMQAFRVKEGQRILNSPGIGAMGFGVPSTIGACVASGGKRTICINGDGGLQLNVQELAVVSNLQLPIKYFVLNNDGYASIKASQRNYFGGYYVSVDSATGVALPDMCQMASVYGIRSARVRTYAELKSQIRELLAAPGPAICDVIVDPQEAVMPKLVSQVKADGTIVSKPMEDLWPFLDREELKANMLIPLVDE